MTIETKYNINDTVYFFNNNKIVKGEVKQIKLEVLEDIITIKYKVFYTKNSRFYGGTTEEKYILEENVNASQDALIESIKI